MTRVEQYKSLIKLQREMGEGCDPVAEDALLDKLDKLWYSFTSEEFEEVHVSSQSFIHGVGSGRPNE